MTDPEFTATVGAIFKAFNERRFGDFAEYMAEDLIENSPSPASASRAVDSSRPAMKR